MAEQNGYEAQDATDAEIIERALDARARIEARHEITQGIGLVAEVEAFLAEVAEVEAEVARIEAELRETFGGER